MTTPPADTSLEGACLFGETGWTMAGDPGPITACSCTLYRRYGALWAYDYERERVHVTGGVAGYSRPHADPSLENCSARPALASSHGVGCDWNRTAEDAWR